MPSEAKAILNSTHRHGEWISVPASGEDLLSWVVYPDRSDKASTVLITAAGHESSDWLRAVADAVALEGFIAVVPDVTAGERRLSIVRSFMTRLPAANGRSADLAFSSAISVSAGGQDATFERSQQGWSQAIGVMNRLMENDSSEVIGGSSQAHGHQQLSDAELRSQPAVGVVQGTSGRQAANRGPRGYPAGKLDNLPAGLFTARTTLLRSTVRGEWVDVPMPTVYTGKMRTRITYPDGDAKTAIVVVMQHGPGMDDWMRAVGDQLSRDGFIALVPDLHTGMGPNGGGYESFDGPDAAFAANARLNPMATLAAYAAVRDYALKLPGANGKSASLGFCMGGSNSWTLATRVPELSAAVVFYGTAPDDRAMLEKIKAPVLGFYGGDDARVTATVDGTRATMKELGKSYEAHVYPHATHGFLEFQDLGGNAAATLDSWTRTVAFLKAHLQ